VTPVFFGRTWTITSGIEKQSRVNKGKPATAVESGQEKNYYMVQKFFRRLLNAMVLNSLVTYEKNVTQVADHLKFWSP
jgi:hypothetical protein